MRHRTPKQGLALRGEIQRRLLAGDPLKSAASELGITATYLARLAAETGLTRQWITKAEAAHLKANRRAPLQCPECQRTSEPIALRTHELGRFGTFHECPRCTIGSLTSAWQPAAGLAAAR